MFSLCAHAKAPAVHSGLTMEERVELGISGFIALDLWALVSTKMEKDTGVGKGKMQMANQTRRALQDIALSVVAMCASKPEAWAPWSRPHTLSEIHLERYFGQLRSQFTNSDMNARSYFAAAARVARATAKKVSKIPQAEGSAFSGSRPPLRHDEFPVFTSKCTSGTIVY